MPVYSHTRMPYNKIRAIKKRTLQLGLRKAKSLDPSGNWLAREIFPGDDDATDFNDFDWATAQSSTDFVGWMQDAADLTADDLSSVFTTGETVNDDTFLIIYGLFDMVPFLREDAGANTGEMPGRGTLSAIQFVRGASDIDFWGTEHLYASNDVLGYTDRVIMYEPQEDIDLKMNFTDADSDKFIGLRGYIFEKTGEHMTPKEWSGGKYINPEPWEWGVDPIQELTRQDIWQKKRQVAHNLVQKLLARDVISKADDAVVREVVIGDEDNATDFVDLDYKNAVTSGQESQAIDSASLTQDQFSDILASGETVDDNKTIGFYGFSDKDTCPSLTRIRFADGSANLAVYEVEHCYPYINSGVTGIFRRGVYYEEKDQIKIQTAFRDADIDHNVMFHGLVAERWGHNISKE